MCKLFQMKEIEVSYKGSDGIDNILGPFSIEMHKGESLGVIGSSGAGKSTLGLCLLGLLEEAGGKCLSGKCDIEIPISKISYIPQDPFASLDPIFTVGALLEEVNSNREEVRNALDRVHLSEKSINLKSYPHELSGGMRQRIAIAMALLLDPDLIIADEPTSSLDVLVQKDIMKLFKEINQSGIAFFFITHNIALASSFCTRIAVMHEGKICEIKSTEDLLKNPESKQTRRLLESVVRLKRED